VADARSSSPAQIGSAHGVAVIGGGQAGLAMSYCLKQRGIDHVVLEKNRVGHEWRDHRWDTFCLVTPNWQCRLPGFPYRGPDPHGFMLKDEIVRYLEDYVRSFDPPLHEGVAALSLRARPPGKTQGRSNDGFDLMTTAGECRVDQVVVATGGYHTPQIPRLGERLPDGIVQLHSAAYRNPGQLPEGEVLVVGTGQSGCQIAEDLHLAGRRVHLSVGGAPRTARRYRGRDVVDWLEDMGYYSLPVHEHPLKDRVRAKANHYVTGRDGGRDIDLRQRALEGMRLYGRLVEARGSRLQLAADLKTNLDQADAVAESIKTSIDKHIATRAIDAPTEARYLPVWQPAGETAVLDLTASGITSVVWCTGFRSDYRWIEVPIFDGRGYPVHTRGVTAVAGLYFLGLPWLHTWGSGRFSGVAADADHLADHIEAQVVTVPLAQAPALNELALGS
jgi:putative flavoprotein involved in K+ transport